VEINADQCQCISPPSASGLGDALYRQEYFISVPSSPPGSVLLAHMLGDDAEEEPDEPAVIVQGRLADRFLQ
jgi:hypothetical protein